jgi:glycosyltransferase involved in cell wall biosynthesis
MVSSSHPLVSIGLPVYNGEAYLRESLDSLLAQTYEHLELIISDNASTDKTADICREYVDRDSRVRYSRNECNIGMNENFNRVFELASGEFFMWGSHDDRRSPEYVESCVQVLCADPSIVLCYSESVFIDDQGRESGHVKDEMNTVSMPTYERMRQIIRELLWCNMVYGLYRSDALRQTGVFRRVYGPDRVLLLEMSSLGSFYQIPKPLLYSRRTDFSKPENRKKRREIKQFHVHELDPVLGRKKTYFPALHLVTTQASIVLSARMQPIQKLMLLAYLLRRSVRWYGRLTVSDLVDAIEDLVVRRPRTVP